jgi:acyl-coenzyme A thioesterase PaaI-like protein
MSDYRTLADQVIGDATPPQGIAWQPLANCGAFTEHVGPIFEARAGLPADEPARYGFRVAPHHANGRDSCHGGMLATFLDLCMVRGLFVYLDAAGGAPTVSMSADFLAPVGVGDWVESRVRVLRTGKGTCFVDTVLVVGDTPVLRGSGVFKRPRLAKAAD